MRATIDSEGRIEIPEALREELGLVPGDEVELRLCNDHIELQSRQTGDVPEGDIRLEERDGFLVAVAPPGTPTVTVEDVNEILAIMRDPLRRHELDDDE